MSSYFERFATDERVIRAAVAENYANYGIADQMRETGRVVVGTVQGHVTKIDGVTAKRVATGATVYTHGSKEPKAGVVRKPGTRRVGKGPQRYPRFSER